MLVAFRILMASSASDLGNERVSDWLKIEQCTDNVTSSVIPKLPAHLLRMINVSSSWPVRHGGRKALRARN
jgi:hypothetical protein